MGTLDSLVAGGGLNSLQDGYVSSLVTTGAGQDLSYVDITVTSVDTAKTITSFEGGLGLNDARAMQRMGTNISYVCTTRMVNSTTLRIASPASEARIVGQWTVAELR